MALRYDNLTALSEEERELLRHWDAEHAMFRWDHPEMFRPNVNLGEFPPHAAAVFAKMREERDGRERAIDKSRKRCRALGASRRRLDFDAVNRAALANLDAILMRWLPDGRRRGREFVARNPKRADKYPGSFAVNLVTGRWADFATGDKGGDIVSLAAYLDDLSQGEAAIRLAGMLGMERRSG